jgi:hypothetical protein
MDWFDKQLAVSRWLLAKNKKPKSAAIK